MVVVGAPILNPTPTSSVALQGIPGDLGYGGSRNNHVKLVQPTHPPQSELVSGIQIG
jgi:hypothetical protein